MIYEICSKASENITDRHQAIERGRQTSLGDQRKKRGEEEEKVSISFELNLYRTVH